MKNRKPLATIVARFLTVSLVAAIGLTSTQVLAQAGRAPSTTAVIDIGHILKNHNRYRQAMQNLEGKFVQNRDQLKRDSDFLVKLQQRLRGLTPGTPEYRQVEEEITQRDAALRALATRHKRDVQTSDAQIKSSVYHEISNAVEQHAQRYNIGLVLQFNGDDVKGNTPQEVLSAFRRPVVFVEDNRDITAVILEKLNRGTQPPPPRNVTDRRNVTNPRQVVPRQN